jgi:hypothetical protein
LFLKDKFIKVYKRERENKELCTQNGGDKNMTKNIKYRKYK